MNKIHDLKRNGRDGFLMVEMMRGIIEPQKITDTSFEVRR